MTISRNHIRRKRKAYDHESNQERPKKTEDYRLHWIYEQYHSGKALTIDDFKYLGKKDPEGCGKLIRSMLNTEQEKTKDEERLKKEKVAIECIQKIEDELRIAKHQLDLHNINYEDGNKGTYVNVQESLENVKQMVKIMNEADLADMMNHLYEITELREQYEDVVLGWERLLEETDRYYSPFVEAKTTYRV